MSQASKDPSRDEDPTPRATPAVELSAAELPAYCPNPQMPIWSSHPKVFLDVGPDRDAACPYCGTRYRLRAGESVKGHH